MPEEPLPGVGAHHLIFKNVHLGGSLIGSPSVIRDMFAVAAKHDVKSWIKEVPMENVNEAVVDMDNGKARYRFVLVNSKHQHLAAQ